MRRTHPARGAALAALALSTTLALLGADSPKKKKAEPPPPKVDETVGSIATVLTSEIPLQGVGLVVGLDNTGSNPPPSEMRKKLLDTMRKAGVEHPEHWLEKPSCAMVIVRAVVPNGIGKSDPLDVTLELPPASGTTSLAGGKLLLTELAPVMMTAKGQMDDHVLAVAGGPIMTGSPTDPNDVKFGRVLGGGRVKKDIPYNFIIHDDRRSVRTAKLVEDVVKLRFHENQGGEMKGMAIPTRSDDRLILRVPKVYHHNQSRYFQVIQSLPLVDTPNLRARRMDTWGKELLVTKASGKAALKLEGIGSNAVPTLKVGLASPDPLVRFFAAESLAYLGSVDGAAVLAETAKARPEFRSYALKALAAMDQSAGLMRLRELMGHPDVQLRYGAFDALRSFDENDPYLGRVRLTDAPRVDPDGDPLALQVDDMRPRRPQPGRDEPFRLYLVDCEGPPMVHVSRTLRAEVVVFGKGQKLLTPVVLGAGGAVLLNAAEGDDRVQISRITGETLDQPDNRLSAPLDIVEVVRHAARLNATYPEVVAILAGAGRQKNLPGPLVVDAIPLPDKAYSEAQLLGATEKDKAKKDDDLKKASDEEKKKPRLRDRIKNLFDR